MKPHTPQQRKALHLYFTHLADALNEAGYSIQKTLRHDIDIPWTKETVKELLWRPVQEAITDKHSTTQLDRLEPGQVYEVLNLHLGQKLGIHVPFPSEETQYENKAA